MKQQKIAVIVFLGIFGGLLIHSYQVYEVVPIVYAQEPDAPRVILVGTSTKEKTIEEKIRDTFPEDPEIALSIAKCESSFNPKAVNNSNTNGTTDGGLWQINSIHDTRLKELGLDKFDVDDSLVFARILYEERGFRPWVCRDLI